MATLPYTAPALTGVIRTFDAVRDAALAAISAGVHNALDRGAAGNGTTDDAAALQAGLTAAAGAAFVIPGGRTYRVTAPIKPAAGTVIHLGAGAVFKVDAGSSHKVFDLDDVSNVTIDGQGATINKASGAALGSSGKAIYIRGNCADIVVSGITIDQFSTGIVVEGSSGTAGASTCRRITFRDVTSKRASTGYGIELDECDTIILDNCYFTSNWLDGIKGRKQATNVTLDHCHATDNGRWVPDGPDPAGNGDGVDAFYGGSRWTIIGGEYGANYGSGLDLKSGANNTDPLDDTWGEKSDIQVIGVRCVGNLNGSGLYAAVSTPGIGQDLANHFTVVGGEFDENSQHGIYLDGRNMTLVAPQCRRNTQRGIDLGDDAMDIEIVSPRCIANGWQNAGLYEGISLSGTNITLRGGTIIGVDADDIDVEADYAALTVYHLYAVRVKSTAVGPITIDRPNYRYYSGATRGIRVDMTTGVCVVHDKGSGIPAGHGSVGSTWLRTDATTGAILFAKIAGAPNSGSNWGTTNLAYQKTTGVSLNFPSIAAGATEELTAVYTGATTSDIVTAQPSTAPNAGLVWCAYVSAADTVTVRMGNITGSAIDPGAITWLFKVTKF